MLTGYQTATVGSFLINDLKEFVDTGLELFLFQVIGALVDVKVSVTCVAEGLDDQSAIFAGLVDKIQIIRDLIDRNYNVTLVSQLCLVHDGFQEGRTCCPGILDLSRGICYQNIHSASI